MAGSSDAPALTGEMRLKVGQRFTLEHDRKTIQVRYYGSLMQPGGYPACIFKVFALKADLIDKFVWNCPKLPAVVDLPCARFVVVGYSGDFNTIVVAPADAEAPAVEKKPVTAEDAVKTLRAHLGRPPWLQSIGIGSEGGFDVIRLLTNSEQVPCQSLLTHGWLGFPVLVTYVGPLRLLSGETAR